MSQQLRLPINDAVLQAGYKNAQYKKEWGYNHFGADFTSGSRNVELYGLGEGRVIAAGLDGTQGEKSGCGYVLVVQYDGCQSWKTGKTAALACTYMHMREQPLVSRGDRVTTETLLGHYGNTGGATSGAHLHIQFDTDVAFALCCAGLAAAGHAILKAGTVDSTVDPLTVLYKDKGQTLTGQSAGWWDAATLDAMPCITEQEDELEILRKEIDALNLKIRAQADGYGKALDKLEQIKKILG